ncbi:hypothetical protein CONPUDRAFT_144703 [Coniophora puteana RWD-64-598 SS2]|uniref:RRM domain-containing protein n=1 Tax=Coniophora puteana (strain RWD-64-598) TaxID=741705 RepID=A0A5M3MNN3_CONPW|nr:uncharacterized protein CONPUDRAFT_144703 [Coniophora puteana RWD-64-598 SS2]EIW80762.1 hypothetical protein CONPUDRAFT_144703 [Coniophora puteana RWD-64-598 SS2]
MASLLERLDVAPDSASSGGPTRAKRHDRASPYARPPKGNPEDDWKHDMYEDADKPRALSTRLSAGGAVPRRPDARLAERYLQEATGGGGASANGSGSSGLSIKGASNLGNVVHVEGLVKGTTPADVEAIFKRCGAILSSSFAPHPAVDKDGIAVRLKFKTAAAAQDAVAKFNGQPADGRTLKVAVVGGASASLGGRLGGLVGDLAESGSVDALMDGDNGGSKMRSDSILTSDPRASVQVVPPGADPKMYQQQQGGGRGRGRGRGRRGGGGRRGRRGGAEGGMEVD